VESAGAVERCLACEAVVSRESREVRTPLRAVLYRLKILKLGTKTSSLRDRFEIQSARHSVDDGRGVRNHSPCSHGLASEAALHGVAFPREPPSFPTRTRLFEWPGWSH
jgi:hypothetical protein